MLSMYMALIDSAEQQTKFERIYYAYRRQMFYVAKSVLNNDHLAEDALQEAFINIAKRISYIHEEDTRLTRSYVLTVARNAALYIQKKEAKNAHESIPYEEFEDFITPTPESSYFATETAASLKAIVANMPTIYQDVLLLKVVHEMDYENISKTLHRPETTVRRQVLRAKKILANMCKKEGIYVNV